MVGAMILRGSQMIFDVEEAARTAYEIVRSESRRPTWWSDWEDTAPEERDVWIRAAAGAISTYDPKVAGFAIEELKRLWTIIGPVIRPYSALLLRPDEKSCARDGDDSGDRLPT